MFYETMRRWAEGIKDAKTQWSVIRLLFPLFDRASSLCLSSPGLEQDTGSTAKVKAGNAFYYLAGAASGSVNTLVKVASGDMAALAGTVVNDTFNVFCFFGDSAGNITSAMGTAGATLGAMQFPQFPEGKAFLGLVIINPTGTGNFVGGTTSLTDGTVVPNAVYINGQCGFDPHALTGLNVTP